MKTVAFAAVALLSNLAFADALNVPLKSGPVKELTIDAPKGAKVDAKGGGSFVLGGAHFEVAIVAASEKDFKAEHDAVMNDSGQKPSKVVADTKTLFHWQNDLMGDPIFQFQSLVTVGKTTFMCRSSNLDNQMFTKADSEAMIKACQSLKAK